MAFVLANAACTHSLLGSEESRASAERHGGLVACAQMALHPSPCNLMHAHHALMLSTFWIACYLEETRRILAYCPHVISGFCTRRLLMDKSLQSPPWLSRSPRARLGRSCRSTCQCLKLQCAATAPFWSTSGPSTSRCSCRSFCTYLFTRCLHSELKEHNNYKRGLATSTAHVSCVFCAVA